MLVTTLKICVRYAETDKMGYAYYGAYATYLEVARVEALRTLGIRYSELEDRGVMLPVRDVHIRYRSPLKYDELFTVITTIQVPLEGCRMRFTYELYNELGELCTEAETTLVFASVASGRPIEPPQDIKVLLERAAKA